MPADSSAIAALPGILPLPEFGISRDASLALIVVDPPPPMLMFVPAAAMSLCVLKLPVTCTAPSPYNLMSLVVEISDASVSTEPAPRAYKVMSCKPEKEISGPKMIEPFCVARRRPRIPEKVSGPPGEPDVIPLTAIRPRLTSPFAVEIVGLPAN